MGNGAKGILMTDVHLYYRSPFGTEALNYKDIEKMTFGFFYTFVHMLDGRVITMETIMGRKKLFNTVRDIATLLQTENLALETRESIRSAGRCSGCGAQLTTHDPSCPYCGRQLETYEAQTKRTAVGTVLKKLAITIFLLIWFGLAIWFLIIPIINWAFDDVLLFIWRMFFNCDCMGL